MSNNPFTGAGYLIQGLKLITQPGLRRYVIIPLVINVAVFLGIGLYAFGTLDAWIEELIMGLPAWLQWLDWLSEILIFMSISLIMFFTFTMVAVFISAPFNGPLAEAVEKKLTGTTNETEQSWGAMIADVPKIMVDEGNKLFYSATRSLPFLILFIIPVVNVIASAAWLIFSAWLLALQYLDFPLGNHQYKFKQQRELLKTRRGLVMGFGGAVLFFTLIPGLNLLIIPAAVAGATALYVNELKSL